MTNDIGWNRSALRIAREHAARFPYRCRCGCCAHAHRMGYRVTRRGNLFRAEPPATNPTAERDLFAGIEP